MNSDKFQLERNHHDQKEKFDDISKRKIRFDYVSDANTEVQVDESKFDVYCDPETKRYSSSKLLYTDYASMDDLVKALIDKHPDYRESTT